MSWKIKFEGNSLMCPYFSGYCENNKVENKYCNEADCVLRIISKDEEAKKMVAGTD